MKETITKSSQSWTLWYFYDESGRPFAFKCAMNNGATVGMFYYVLNLQGDVVSIVAASGMTVANYTYNAWGEVTSVTSANGTALTSPNHIANLNPLRYRGYYYDTETGFYYLQSRYYDPVLHRFINADSLASTGQGIVGTNMFAYCLNNPVVYCDNSGCYANDGATIDIAGQIIEAIKEALVAAAGATVAATAEVAVPIALIAFTVLGTCYGLALYFEDGVSCDGDNTKSASDYLEPEAEIWETLGPIASRYGRFKCKEAAAAVQAELLRNNLHGSLITIQYSGSGKYNNVWSESTSTVISENGFHCGILYAGVVYCNVHPFGLPKDEWINDFIGFGEREIREFPF